MTAEDGGAGRQVLDGRVPDAQLVSLFGRFARSLVADSSSQAILDRLVATVVEALAVPAAGVVLIVGHQTCSAVTGVDAASRAPLQRVLGDSLRLQAPAGGGPAALDLLRGSPGIGRATGIPGLGAVVSFPLRRGDLVVGALDLYSDRPDPLDERGSAAARALGDMAVAYLLSTQARNEAGHAAEHYRRSALHDPLTGLPNRALLQERVEHAVLRAQRSRAPMAVLFADLDRFTQVNDSYGHQVGDQVLVAVAGRLAGLLRPGDTLARVSGDEFVILCEELRDAGEVEMLAARITGGFRHPFRLSGTTLLLSASVGIAFSGQGEDVPADLVRHADAAMYQAKRSGGARHQVIDLRGLTGSRDRESMERDLVAAMAGDGLSLAYHPIVRTVDGELLGVEALLRWERGGVGPVAPAEVVALAESTGLIGELGRIVLRRACLDRASWAGSAAGRPLGLSVNVSAQQLMERGFCAFVEEVLTSTGLDPGELTLEMTESVLLADGERALLVLSVLKDLGVRIALDDFGTGYSSLSYLKRLRVDAIKLDQGFVADVGHDGPSAAIIGAVTDLSHSLGVCVVAEGVESEAQRDRVLALGCENAQGYYYARPMPPRDLLLLLSNSDGPVHLPA